MTGRAGRAARVVAFASIVMACGRGPAPSSDGGDARDAGDAALADASARTGPPPSPPPTDALDGGVIARSLPRVQYRGGPVLRHPRIVTVTFPTEDAAVAALLARFGETITKTDWWKAVTEGYCVTPTDCIGEGSGVAVRLDEKLAGEVHERQIVQMLVAATAAGRFGKVDENTLLVAYLPNGIKLMGGKGAYCAGRRATHASTEAGGSKIVYAIVPRCGDEGELTGAASHEILEATTNPSTVERGFALLPGAHAGAFAASGVEPVDPCGLLTQDGHRTFERGFVFQRAWSNRAASMAQDPCVPAPPNRPYVALVPRQKSLLVPSNGSTTVVLDASTATDVERWAISAFDLGGAHDHDVYVDVSLDKATIRRGESAVLTVKVKKPPPDQRALVGVVSTVGVSTSMWPITVNTY